MEVLRRSLDRAIAQRIDPDPSQGRMSRATSRRTESQSLALPAAVYAGVWAAGGWLLAGASRGGDAPILQVLFHLAAIAGRRALPRFRSLRPRERSALGTARPPHRRLPPARRRRPDPRRRSWRELSTPTCCRCRARARRPRDRVESCRSARTRWRAPPRASSAASTLLAASSAQQAAAAGEVTAAMEELSRTAARSRSMPNARTGW